MDQENRIVVLIDMDCFYCQVEEKLNPNLQGKPVAVVQYNPWKGGGIIAVNYEARAKGVTRHMRGDEAKEKCPEINLPSVPCLRGKADTSRYREAGKEVARVLQKFTSLLERASVDEAYLDITLVVKERMNTLDVNTISIDMMPNTYALGYDSIQHFIDDIHNYGNECIDYDLEHSKQLLVGAVVVSEIRKAVFQETGFKCSAGIGCNKILAKLVCAMNKPNKQTILPKYSINILYRTLPIKKVKHLGGKFGDNVCSILNISKMGELQEFSEKQLQAKFGDKNGTWLYNIARGMDSEPVQARFNSKSIGCCKQLRGKSALADLDSLKSWLKDLSEEIEDRLEKDSLETNRVPKQMVVSFTAQFRDGRDVNSSRSHNFTSEEEICAEFIASKALEFILDSTESTKTKADENNRKLKTLIKFLAISVGKFEEKNDKRTKKISDFLLAASSKITLKNIGISKDNVEIANPTDNDENENVDEKKEGKQLKKKKQENEKESEVTKQMNTDQSNGLGKFVDENGTATQAFLHKQELFFPRFLNSAINEIGICKSTNPGNHTKNTDRNVESIVLGHDVDQDNGSDDSNYSGSTINDEINKSISLFKDDPTETDRISNIRNMLGSSVHIEQDNEKGTRISPKFSHALKENKETAYCPDCKKLISIEDLETHSDYHMALKLRQEERKASKLEKEMKVKKSCETEIVGQSRTARDGRSITNFIVKFDINVPLETCYECRRKIPSDKFTEHLDFHEAQKLNRELNKKINSISEGKIKKRKSISPNNGKKVPRRTIESFFKNII